MNRQHTTFDELNELCRARSLHVEIHDDGHTTKAKDGVEYRTIRSLRVTNAAKKIVVHFACSLDHLDSAATSALARIRAGAS